MNESAGMLWKPEQIINEGNGSFFFCLSFYLGLRQLAEELTEFGPIGVLQAFFLNYNPLRITMECDYSCINGWLFPYHFKSALNHWAGEEPWVYWAGFWGSNICIPIHYVSLCIIKMCDSFVGVRMHNDH